MSKEVRVHVAAAEEMPTGEVFLRVHVSATSAGTMTAADFIGTATLTLPEGPR